MISVGFDTSRRIQQKFWVSFSLQLSMSLPSRSPSFSAYAACSFLTPIPCITSATAVDRSEPGSFDSFATFPMLLENSLVYQSTSSSSTSATSASGSPVPASVTLPSLSTLPEASTTCRRASDCAATERNWLPSPLPIQAPLIRPGRSVTSIGMNLHPSSQREFFGLSCTPNSLWTHNVTACAVPEFGDLVVNG